MKTMEKDGQKDPVIIQELTKLGWYFNGESNNQPGIPVFVKVDKQRSRGALTELSQEFAEDAALATVRTLIRLENSTNKQHNNKELAP